MQQIVNSSYCYAKSWLNEGEVADYIPELCKVDKDQFGVCITNLVGQTYGSGDFEQKFTVQSICKVILLITALKDVGFDAVFARVGMEPTGDKFNSIIRLETGSGKPLNPMINAGAIAVSSCLKGTNVEEKFEKVLAMANALFGKTDTEYDKSVFLSEQTTGDRNRALAYMMRSGGVFENNVDEILNVYFKSCSILASCKDISHMGAVLANEGRSPTTGKMIVDPFFVKVVLSKN